MFTRDEEMKLVECVSYRRNKCFESKLREEQNGFVRGCYVIICFTPLV